MNAPIHRRAIGPHLLTVMSELATCKGIAS